VDNQGVAGFGAFDEKGAGERIVALGKRESVAGLLNGIAEEYFPDAGALPAVRHRKRISRCQWWHDIGRLRIWMAPMEFEPELKTAKPS